MVAILGMAFIGWVRVHLAHSNPPRPMRSHRRAPILLALPILIALTGCRIADAAGTIRNADGADDAAGKFSGCYDHSCVGAPVGVPSVPPLVSLATQMNHTCGLTSVGEAWCWGDNSAGQLGDGTDQPRGGPVRVAGNVNFRTIAVGATFTCGLAQDGIAYCWGNGVAGQLGQTGPELCAQGTMRCARSPLAISGFTFTAIAVGRSHACGIASTGATFCWGFNSFGETGSTLYGETVPVPGMVPGGKVFTSLAAGDSFTCALTAAGRAYCWGAGDRGELGRPVPVCTTILSFENHCSATPVPVITSATFTMLSVGNSHSCALTPSGVAQCWGDNGQGQLGAGGYANSAEAVVAQSGKSWSTINASGAVTCGTPPSGPSACWGLNLFGKLGIGTRLELSTIPLAIAGNHRFVSFAGGQYHVCALTAEGAAFCWGLGRMGQLGTGEMLP